MGILTGGLNGRRFRVDTELPVGFRDLFLEQVRTNAFVDCDAGDAEPRIGWVDVFDPANATFELVTFLIDRYVALALRADTKRVQSTYLKICVARRAAAAAAERGVESLSKQDHEAVAEEVEADLLKRALPTVATTDVVWDILTGNVVVFSTSEGTLEHVRQLAAETFGIALRPERLVDWLYGRLTREEIEQHLASIGGAARGEDPLEGHELVLASDFLTWLWLQSEETDGRFRVIDAGGTPRAVLTELVDAVAPEPPPVKLDEVPGPPSEPALDPQDAPTVLAEVSAEARVVDVAVEAPAVDVAVEVAVETPAEAPADVDEDDDEDPDDAHADADLDDDDDDASSWAEVTETLRGADVTLWIDSRLKLQELTERRDPDEAPATTILLGAAPSTSPEARRNLHLGKRPVEAQLGLTVNDLECSMAIAATPDGVRISSLKIPFAVKTGRDERLLERMVLYELLHTTVARLFQQFFLARTSPAWTERMERWLAEGLAAK